MTVSNCFGFDFLFLLAACSHRSLNSCPAVTGSVRWELVCATCLVHCKDRSCRVQVGRRADTDVRSRQPVLRTDNCLQVPKVASHRVCHSWGSTIRPFSQHACSMGLRLLHLLFLFLGYQLEKKELPHDVSWIHSLPSRANQSSI
jgi:hypothetical protein